jgi:hypothetical protein
MDLKPYSSEMRTPHEKVVTEFGQLPGWVSADRAAGEAIRRPTNSPKVGHP